MGLVLLIVGLIVMLGSHIFVTFREARARAIGMLGLSGYRVAFSLVSLAGLVLIVWGYADYRADEWIQLWAPPAGMRHVAVGLMLISVVLVVAAFIPGHIKTWTRHPMLASIKLWAFAHLLSNGDLGSILLFGSFLAWAVYARIAARRRGDLGPHTASAGWTGDVFVVAIGVVIYLLLGVYFHPYVIGVPVFVGA